MPFCFNARDAGDRGIFNAPGGPLCKFPVLSVANIIVKSVHGTIQKNMGKLLFGFWLVRVGESPYNLSGREET